MANTFDQFDAPAAVADNPFDKFDAAVSPYSPEGISDTNQRLVSAIARRRQLREEADADAARPKVFVGVNAPFSDHRLATFEVPAELAAFGSEAMKSSPSVAAGAAAASAATPFANESATFLTPIPYAPTLARYGIPLVAGGLAAMGERFAQERALPKILPEGAARLYRDTGEIAAENPLSAQIGQIAGAGPFFRPGLPIGTTGAARLATPLITGGIGAGIEGAQQIGAGEFDPQKLAIAGLGGALMNRETGLGARIAPNLVAAVIRIEAAPTPEAKIQVLDQEVKLAGDTLSPVEQRGALDLKQQLEGQVDAQKAAEQQAKEAERVAKEQQRAQAEAQKAAQSALQPPEIPKSTQILAEPAKAPSIANVATEVATQTEGSPFALQNKLNELTAVPAGPALPEPLAANAPTPEAIKATQIKNAVSDKTTEYIYSVQRGPDGKTGGFTQVDAIQNGENTVSSNPSDLRKAGAKIPEVPEWVPQGRYTLEELRAIIKGGPPEFVTGKPVSIKGWHATDRAVPVDEINPESWFSNSKDAVDFYYSGPEHGTKIHAEVEMKNPLVVSYDDFVRERQGPTWWQAKAAQEGHDGVIIQDIQDGDRVSTVFAPVVKQNSEPQIREISREGIKQGETTNALQEPSTGKILQRPPEGTGEAGSERQRVEPSQQGAEAAAASQAGNQVRQGAVQESLVPLHRQEIVWGLENIPFGETAKADIESGAGAKTMQALGRAGYDVKTRLKMSYGEIPYPTKAEFLKGTERYFIGEGLEYLKKVRKEISTLGLDVRRANLPEVADFDSAEGYYEAAKTLESKMRNSGASLASALVETKQMEVPYKKTDFPTAPSRTTESAPRTAEQRLNDAGVDLPPISGMSRAAKRAELDAAGITTYKGKPLDEANPAEISNAVGKLRRGDLTAEGEKPGVSDRFTDTAKGRSQRGAISPSVLAPAGGAVLGGGIGFGTTDRREGESERDFQFRRLRNAAIGAGVGGALGAGAIPRGVTPPPVKPPRREGVSVPTPEEGQGVRQLAEKVIEDRGRSTELRKTLAENPEIIYDKFLLSDLTDRAAAATPEELASMRVSGDVNQQAMATIELANRAAAEGRDAEAADLYAQSSKFFTSPAQLLGVAKAVRSPQAFTTAIKTELKQSGRTTTPAQETKITELGRKTILTEQALAKAERAAKEDFSPENQTAYENAKKAASEAGTALLDYTSQIVPKGLDDTIIQIIQGNLLTPLSQVANVYGNILFQPVRRGAMSIASGIDAIHSGLTGRGRTIDRLNPLPSGAEMKAFAEGTKIAAKELLTGPSADSYVKGEVQRGFRPIRSLMQAITGKNLPVQADGTVALSDRAKKLIEATIGAPPEVMFRLLNLGDRGFRRAAEVETLLEQARLKGLKGRDLEKFIEFPDKATQALLNTEARKAIFAQDNAGVNQLNQFLDSGIAKLLHLDQIPVAKGAIKVFGRLNVPFRQFPLNYVMTALNFAAPELAFAKALYYSSKGQRRQALTNIGEGIMGATMYGAAAYLWKHGLISEPTDKEAKNRSVQYDNMGGQRINISGLERALAGGNPTWKRDDTTIDWGRMGIPAPVFYVYTADQAKGNKALQQTGVRPPEDKSALGQIANRVSSYPGIGQFALDQSFLAGSSAFLEALKNGFQGPEADAWAANMFRAGSTLAVPNTVEALARANYQYIPDLTGDTLSDTVKNIWEFKTFQLPKDDRALLKRDIWGEPVNRTPPGVNPYVYQFLDVTKGQTRPADPFKAALVKTFNESNNLGAYPALPGRSMSVEGVTAKLEPRDYETLQAVTGRLRRQEAEPMVLDPEFLSIPAGERVAELEKIYSRAASDAKEQLLSDEAFRMKYFPEAFGGAPGARVTRRTTAARNRLEQQEPAPAAANPFDAFGASK